MGIYTMGPPEELVRLLQQTFALTDFIETGTYQGATAAWAAERFQRVVSIELSSLLYKAARHHYAGTPNIEVRHGDSGGVLRDLVPALEKPALFWLDAHWSGGPTAGEDYECPLLAEIAAIDASPLPHFMLIDDARLFVAPPPPPHRPEQWPDLAAIRAALGGKDRYVMVFQDVIVAAPRAAEACIAAYVSALKRPPADLLRL